MLPNTDVFTIAISSFIFILLYFAIKQFQKAVYLLSYHIWCFITCSS